MGLFVLMKHGLVAGETDEPYLRPKKEGQARRSVPEVNTDAVTPVMEPGFCKTKCN